MTLLWKWSGFAFQRGQTSRLDTTLREAQTYSVGSSDLATNNVVACLRVLVALRQFRDLPGFEDDIGLLLGWGQGQHVSQLQSRLVYGRERCVRRHRGRTSPPTNLMTALVDTWRKQPRFSWLITAKRLEYYHRCLAAMREILASPGTILNVTPTTTTNPALPRPSRPDWFHVRVMGSQAEDMALRLELERGLGLGLGAPASSSFELPLRLGGQGIPQQPRPEPQPQLQPCDGPSAVDSVQAPAAAEVEIVAGGSFNLPIRQKEEVDDEKDE